MPRRGGGRIPSGPWGRLKPVDQDPLQSIGLLSKGDERLLNSKTQEWYYNQIIARFLSFCTDSGEKDELLRRLESLDIRLHDHARAGPFARTPTSSPFPVAASSSGPSEASEPSSTQTPTPAASSPSPSSSAGPASQPAQSQPPTPATASSSSSSARPSRRLFNRSAATSSSHASSTSSAHPSSAGPSTGASNLPSGSSSRNSPDNTSIHPSMSLVGSLRSPDDTKALQEVLMSLRKLREGIVATKRADNFSTQVYIFSIRLSILVKHPESYHPAILHLLRYIAVWHPMTATEIEEIAGYFMLDTACRRRDLTEAYFIKRDFKIKNRKLNIALRALAHDNYIVWHKIKRDVDTYCLKLLEWADEEMRLHTLKCFGRSYLNVDLKFLELATDRKWKDLKEKDGVGWELDEEKVTIRRVRAK